MMLGLIFYFFAFILIWFITELAKADRRKDGLSYPISLFTSYLFSLFGITDYVRRGFYSSTDYPYTASKGKDAFAGLVYAYGCTDACALFEDFSILGSSWNFKGYFLSIVAYIAYLFTKLPKVIESYRYHATIRYAVWVALVLGIILSML